MPELPDPDQLPADYLRGLLSPRISRRQALHLGGLSAMAATLAACGVKGAKKGPSSSAAADAAKTFWAAQKKTGTLDFANWPLYIDVSDKNKNDHPSIDLFTQQTGIKVKYSEVIQDDPSFFGKIQPQLAAGQNIGYDIIVITNGTYLDKLMQLGYLQALDQKLMTNFKANASPLVKSPSYDKGNTYTMAWQSGMTGIGYDPKKVGKEITSWQDLLDPKLKGKVGMFADNQDLPNAALLAVGVNSEKSTEADWHKAADWLKSGRSNVRKYYEQGYADALSKGDIWASMAWSGDIFQLNANGSHLKFVVPKEGAVLWTDNMCIPKGAKHPFDAMTYMDFVYKPEIAAMLAEYVNYITPVPGAQAVIEQDAAKDSSLKGLATSPLIFPNSEDFSRLHRYRVLTPAEERTWNSTFQPIYES